MAARWDCPQEPSGTISVQGADGEWYDVVFDGPSFGETTDPAVCDGCGTAWLEGMRLGEVCVDAGELLDWDGVPWE